MNTVHTSLHAHLLKGRAPFCLLLCVLIPILYFSKPGPRFPYPGLLPRLLQVMGPVMAPHLLVINAIVESGRLTVTLTGANCLEAARVRALADHVALGIREVIAHCADPHSGGLSPADFPMCKFPSAKFLQEQFGNGRQVEDCYPLIPLQQVCGSGPRHKIMHCRAASTEDTGDNCKSSSVFSLFFCGERDGALQLRPTSSQFKATRCQLHR